jgi:RNA polymerase sigma-70 factor, ECF subfamily
MSATTQINWDEAFRKNKSALLSLACQIVGPNLAEDVVQNAFMNAVRFNNFQGRSKLFTWLYKLTRNSALMMLRHNKSVYVLSEESLDNCLLLLTIEPCQFEEVERHELIERVKHAILLLPPDMQLIIRMRFAEYSYREVSTMKGCSIGAVKSQYSRAIKRLQLELNA